MKFLGKISVLILLALIASGSLLAQNSSGQSRLNTGKDAKKTVSAGSDNVFFNAFPKKLNLSSKAEYTQYYRNILLNNDKGVKSVEVLDSKPAVIKTPETATVNAEKIKFGNIYPNPAVAHADIQYEILENYRDARATVMNLVGTSLLEYNIVASNNKLRINTSGLESGIYMVQFVVDGKKVSTRKLLVERN